jgi:hypothetical protein
MLFKGPNGLRVMGERRAEGDERVRCMDVHARRRLNNLARYDGVFVVRVNGA